MSPDWFGDLCVAIRRNRARHHETERPWIDPEPPEPFDLESHIMTLSADAQSVADRLVALPDLIKADKDAAVAAATSLHADELAAEKASHAEDLSAIASGVSAVVASVTPAQVPPASAEPDAQVEQTGA